MSKDNDTISLNACMNLIKFYLRHDVPSLNELAISNEDYLHEE